MKRWMMLALLLLAVPTAPLAAQQSSAAGTQAKQEGLSRTGPLEDQAMEAEASRIASELRCPVCQGLSIQDSPSPLAQQMKDLVRTQLAEGRSEAEIRDYFVSKYGEWVLLEPKPAGFNLLVYLLPALLLVGGAGVIVLAVRRWTAPAPAAPDSP